MQRITILIKRAQRLHAGLQAGCQILQAGEHVDLFFLDTQPATLTEDNCLFLESIRQSGGNWYAIESLCADQIGAQPITLEIAAGIMKNADAVLTF